MVKKYENRLLFLKEFTKELILNSKTETEVVVEQVEEIPEEYGIMVPSLAEEKETAPLVKELEPQKQMIPSIHRVKPVNIQKPRATMQIKPRLPPRQIHPRFKPSIAQIQMPQRVSVESETIIPQPVPGQVLDLGKLNYLVSDPRVTVIECPGPGKFVLARTAGQVAVTKTSLSQGEIQDVIDKFSLASKIPIMSGLFKSAVGNLVLTAVISDIVGSRFIITKMISRFILEQQAR